MSDSTREKQIIDYIHTYIQKGISRDEAQAHIMQFNHDHDLIDPVKALHLIRDLYQTADRQDITFLDLPQNSDEWSLYSIDEINEMSEDEIRQIYRKMVDKYGLKESKEIKSGFFVFEDLKKYVVDNLSNKLIKVQMEADGENALIKRIKSQGRFGNVVLDSAEIAKYLIEKFDIVSFNAVNNKIGQLWVYIDNIGIYKQNSGEIQREIKYIAEICEYKGKITEITREALNHIAFTDPQDEWPFNKQGNLINVKNCVLEIDADNKIVKPRPHSPIYKFTYVLPVIYHPQADPDPIDRVIREWTENDRDAAIMYQIPAQALLQAGGVKCYKKAYLIEGDYDAGKTSYIQLLYRTIGKGNFSGVSIQKVCEDDFSFGDIEHKIMNIKDELRAIPLKYVEPFKDLTGKLDEHRINRKHQQPYYTNLTAVHLFTCNKTPKMKDIDDDAFFRRWEYCNFPHSFDRDPTFYERTFTEENLSGFLKRILITMIDMLRWNDLLIDSETQEIKEKWILATEPVYAFYKDNMQFDRDEMIPRDEVYAGYQTFCEDKGYRILAKNRFSALFTQIEGISGTQVRIIGKQTRVYKGVKWSDTAPYRPYQREIQSGLVGN